MSEGTVSFGGIDNDFLLGKNSSQAGTCRPRSCFIQSNEIERGRYFELNLIKVTGIVQTIATTRLIWVSDQFSDISVKI